jgi:hypothetical protein
VKARIVGEYTSYYETGQLREKEFYNRDAGSRGSTCSLPKRPAQGKGNIPRRKFEGSTSPTTKTASPRKEPL